MGPLTIGVGELELGNCNAGSSPISQADRLLWSTNSGDFLTINASGDKILIKPE